jgi:hypothetical protein
MANEKSFLGDDGELKPQYDPFNPPSAPEISEEEFKKLKQKNHRFKIKSFFKGEEIKTSYQSYLDGELDEESFAQGQLSYFDRHGNEDYYQAYQEALDIAQTKLENGEPFEIGGAVNITYDQQTINTWREKVNEKLQNSKTKSK